MEKQLAADLRSVVPSDARYATRSLAAGGLLAALLSMSCCILPLALVSAGVGGAWMGNLTALSPYQPFFLGAAALMIGGGMWQAYRKPGACAPGSLCAVPATHRITKTLLWIGAALAASAASVNVIGPYLV